MIGLLLMGCVLELGLNEPPEASVVVGPHPLVLAEPDVCEAVCCGLVGSKCCGRAQVELTATSWDSTLVDTAWLADHGSRLRVNLDTRTCGRVAPDGCEASGSVDLEPHDTVTCDLIYDIYGLAPVLCDEAPWDPGCLRQAPHEHGLLSFLFDERDPVDLFVELR